MPPDKVKASITYDPPPLSLVLAETVRLGMEVPRPE